MAEYSIAVIGLGDVGNEVAYRIAEIELPGSDFISRLYVCSRSLEKATIFAEETLGEIESKCDVPMIKEAVPLEELLGKKPDIVINCASVEANRGETDRRIMGVQNLRLNREICPHVPEDSLYLIVTNHPLLLAEDSVLSCGRHPSRTVGMTHIDTMRARNHVAQEYRKIPEHKREPFDPDEICIIGSHDPGEMIIPTNALVNGILLNEINFLSKKINEIEKKTEKSGPLQKKHTGTTKKNTARAVEETLIAAITGKGRVTAAVFCDFNNTFFKHDKDHNDLEKPSRGLYMSMPVVFKNLRAETPDLGWFEKQPFEVKERFCKIAKKQEAFMDSLREAGKIKGYVSISKIPEIALPEEISPGNFDVLSVAIGKHIMHLDKKNGIIKIIKLEEGARKIGYIGEEFYYALKKLVKIGDKKYEYPLECEGKTKINSVEIHNEELYATHSNLGLLVSEGRRLKRIFFKPARSLLKIRNKLFFASENRIYCLNKSPDDLAVPVYDRGSREENEIAALQNLDCIVVSAEKNGTIRLLKEIGSSLHETERIVLPSKSIFCAALFEDGIAFGTESDVFFYNPKTGSTHPYDLKMPVTALACINGNLFAAGKNKLRNVTAERDIPIPAFLSAYNIMSICVM